MPYLDSTELFPKCPNPLYLNLAIPSRLLLSALSRVTFRQRAQEQFSVLRERGETLATRRSCNFLDAGVTNSLRRSVCWHARRERLSGEAARLRMLEISRKRVQKTVVLT